jgi:hypothetical protein
MPYARGSPILGYKVYIIKSDGTYGQEFTFCNGSSTAVMNSLTCSIPATTLTAAPFNLPWGQILTTKVVAFNLYGDSFESQVANYSILLR